MGSQTKKPKKFLMSRIPIPPVSEFLYEEFMRPMNIDALTLAEGVNLPLAVIQSVLSDKCEITPEISEKLGAFFNVSPMLFLNIQRDIYSRSTLTELQYA